MWIPGNDSTESGLGDGSYSRFWTMSMKGPTSRDVYRRASLQNEATCRRPPYPSTSHRCCVGSPHFILSPIILVHFSSRSCGQGKASRLVRLTPLYLLSTCTMTSRIWSTPGTSDPPKNTITQETTVTYSTIENNVEKVNEVSNSTHVEGWPGWSVVRASTPPKLDTDPSSKKRKRKCTEGLEEEPMPQKLKGHLEHCLFKSESWTPSLDASPWPETVYHLEYRRADGSLTERIVKAEPFVGSG
ncbi:hypothetical protein DL95DRAFT_94186 [Leptodontidium sp. 2 PMI_412]|nr:hypothetical protein DL95DRAFT_94186 [Leptodontidium sp. 2 PMI_412]